MNEVLKDQSKGEASLSETHLSKSDQNSRAEGVHVDPHADRETSKSQPAGDWVLDQRERVIGAKGSARHRDIDFGSGQSSSDFKVECAR